MQNTCDKGVRWPPEVGRAARGCTRTRARGGFAASYGQCRTVPEEGYPATTGDIVGDIL